MPPLCSRETRKLVKEQNVIPGAKSLHRGIHFHQNPTHVRAFNSNTTKPRSDPSEILVHHQKIKAGLQDIYARTAALHSKNMTLEERIEESWKAFERAGGKRPKKIVGFAKHLNVISREKKEERRLMGIEMETRGEGVDYRNGSALHRAKDRRIKAYVRRELKRVHKLRRVGDPTPMKQSGKFDDRTATLNIFGKTIRKVKRGVEHRAKFEAVKERGRSGRTMWDLHTTDTNINRPERHSISYTTEFDLGPRAARKAKGKRQK